MNLYNYKDILNGTPAHIATVSPKNKPNISVASNYRIIKENKIVISVNEMINTQKNVESNPNTVITVFDDNWVGLRIFGKAKFYTKGKYFDFCKDTCYSYNKVSPTGRTEPKGAIVITVTKIEELK